MSHCLPWGLMQFCITSTSLGCAAAMARMFIMMDYELVDIMPSLVVRAVHSSRQGLG